MQEIRQILFLEKQLNHVGNNELIACVWFSLEQPIFKVAREAISK